MSTNPNDPHLTDDEPQDETQHGGSDVISLMTGAEHNSRVMLAHKFPRKRTEFLREALEYSTYNEDVAASCMYALPRAGKTITGPTVRFAEIIRYSWRNFDAGIRIIAEERDHVIGEGIFVDLERNERTTRQVKRRIVDREGHRFNADMIQTTGNAAASIAIRNATFNAIPRAIWEPIYDKVVLTIKGTAQTFSTRRANTLAALQQMEVTIDMVLAHFDYKSAEDITMEDLVIMIGLRTSIRDGNVTIEEAFAPKIDEHGELFSRTPQGREQQAQDALARKAKQTPPPQQQTNPQSAQSPADATAASGSGEPTRPTDDKPETGAAAAGDQPPVDTNKEAPKSSAAVGNSTKARGKAPAQKSEAPPASGDLLNEPTWTEKAAVTALDKCKTVTALDELYDRIAEGMTITTKLAEHYNKLRDGLQKQI